MKKKDVKTIACVALIAAVILVAVSITTWIGDDEETLEQVDEGYVESMLDSSGAPEIVVNGSTYAVSDTTYETLDIGDYVIVYDEFFMTHPVRIIQAPANSSWTVG
jgi:hypothetical protein